MLVNSIDPVLLSLGPLEIRYYGIIYALGFLITLFFLRRWSRAGRLGMDHKQIDDFLLYLLIGVVGGARLGHFLFWEPASLLSDPLTLFKVWQGGLSFHGGLIGTAIAVWLFQRKHRVDLVELMDALVIPASLALALGRIANFTNHELVGPVTDVAWCVQYTLVDLLCRHPYQLYASLSHFALFGLLMWLSRKRLRKGALAAWFLIGYGALRTLTDIWRVEDKWLLGLSSGQILSIAMVIVGIWWLRRR